MTINDLTAAQREYLFQAGEIQQWRDHRSFAIYFSLWVPGRMGTARALIARNLIEPYLSGGPYHLSEAGWKLAWELWRTRDQWRGK